MPDCSAVVLTEPSTSRNFMPPTVTAAMVASMAPTAAPSVGVNSERPKKKSPFMPMKTIRKMPITGQVSPSRLRRSLQGSLGVIGADAGLK